MLCNFLCEFFFVKKSFVTILPLSKSSSRWKKCVWVEKISGEKSSVTTSHPRKVRFGGEKFVWVEKMLVKNSSSLSHLEKFVSVIKKSCGWKKILVKNPPSLFPPRKVRFGREKYANACSVGVVIFEVGCWSFQ